MKKLTERDLNYVIDNGIIDTADVLNQIENMKREQILKEHANEIKQYADGWYVVIKDKNQKNGRYRNKRKTKEQAEDLLVQYYRDLEKREVETNEAKTLEELFYEYMEHRKSQVSKNTISRNMTDWKRYYAPRKWFINKPFKQITKIDIDSFFNDVVNQPDHIKDKAFRNMSSILKATFDYAVDAEYIDRSPYRVNVNKRNIISTDKKPSEKEVFTIREQELVFSEMKRRLTKTPTNSIPLAIMLDFETGLRLGELLALRESDIITENNGIKKIHICRQVERTPDIDDLDNITSNIWTVANHTKTERGNREIPLTDVAMQYINQVIEINKRNGVYNDGYLFLTKKGTIITEGSVSEQLKKACDKVNILRRGMHKIRKTYASMLFANGVSVTIISKLLGHADETTAMKYYIFNVEDSQETDNIVLQALNSRDNIPTTTYSNNTVTKSDNKIVIFQPVEKATKASKYKAFY